MCPPSAVATKALTAGYQQADQLQPAHRTRRSLGSRAAHTPNLATLQRIASVLDEELLVWFQRTIDGEVERDFAAVA